MGYAGWKGVTDHLHILVAVSYEPVEGHLSCRFNSGEPLIHSGVPERLYQILLHSPFAGSYYRKHIRGNYPCPFATNPPPYKPTQSIEKKLPPLPETKPIELDLFGSVIRGFPVQKRGRRSSGG